MKQVLQNLKTGTTELVDVPIPRCHSSQCLIASRQSLISAGTERMLVEFGQANLLEKARSQPERVRQALDKVRTDGLVPTLEWKRCIHNRFVFSQASYQEVTLGLRRRQWPERGTSVGYWRSPAGRGSVAVMGSPHAVSSCP